jgi:hypothetical protein
MNQRYAPDDAEPPEGHMNRLGKVSKPAGEQ